MLATLLAGALDEAQRRAVHAHLDGCTRCRLLLTNLAQFHGTPAASEAVTLASIGGDTPGPSPSATLLAQGDRVGHFTVIEKIGHGGMGTVYAAHDALLGRRVALKLVKAAAAHDAEPAQRLMREAQAMAAISHPNVVTVHEVGTFGAQVFLAMELIDGGTLAQWLAVVPRPWIEITRMFIAAGRGLAAAHDAGLVHRDFKPQNVLVTRTGRACVTDFGLVHAERAPASAPSTGELSTEDWSTTLTETGALMGTPRYMAPEQLRGAATDARTDQFAFCVALFEALYRQHPFGDSPREWMTGAIEGRPRMPTTKNGVPGRIHRALSRGLTVDLDGRFATMAALLDELEGALRRRRNVGIAAAASAVVTAAVLGGFVAGRPAGHRICDTAPFDDFGASWRDPVRRDAVATATSTGVSGAQTWPRVAARLDAYAQGGQQLRVEVCAQIDALSGSERALAERKIDCLAMRDQVFDVVLELVATREQVGAAQALDVIYRLPPLASCRDLGARTGVAAPPPPASAAAVTALRRRLMAATAVAWAGHPADSFTTLQALLREAEALDHAPLITEFHAALGEVALATDVDVAIEHLRTAHARALEEGADLQVIATMTSLAGALAERGADRETAGWMLDEAAAWQARLGLAEDVEQALIRATIARGRGDLVGAIALGKHAVELVDVPDSSPRAQVFAHGSLGAMYAEQRDLEHAIEHSKIAAQISETAYGADHRGTLRSRTNLAGLEMRMGDYAAASARLREVLSTYETTGLIALPEAAVALTILAMIARAEGYAEVALGYDRRALEIRTRVFGDVHPLVAESLEKVALDSMNGPNPSEAVPLIRRVLQMRRELHPAGHPAIGLTQIEVSKVLRAAGDLEAAATVAKEAIAALESALPAGGGRMYAAWLFAGMAVLEIGEYDHAVDYLAHAHALGDAAKLTGFDRAELGFARARAHARGDRSSSEARAMAEAARASIVADDPASVALRRDIDAWLGDEP